MSLDTSRIPSGPYCYASVQGPEAEAALKERGVFKVIGCPYWERYNKDKHGPLPEELKEYEKTYTGAYCKFLKAGDWTEDRSQRTSLLWDQIKNCNVNDDWED